MSAPPRRSVPPAPTVPPPPGDETTLVTRATRWKDRVEPWHFLAGVAFVIATAGYAFATWNRGKATVEQLDEAKASVTAQVGAIQGTTTAQFGVLQGQVMDIKERQARLEGKLDILIDLAEQQRDQVRAIARTTGARQIPTPVPDPLQLFRPPP